jgi:hypothetical protein
MPWMMLDRQLQLPLQRFAKIVPRRRSGDAARFRQQARFVTNACTGIHFHAFHFGLHKLLYRNATLMATNQRNPMVFPCSSKFLLQLLY